MAIGQHSSSLLSEPTRSSETPKCHLHGPRPAPQDTQRHSCQTATDDADSIDGAAQRCTDRRLQAIQALIEAMADCSSVCEALHLPVQSGDDAVLRRMGRQYTVTSYREADKQIDVVLRGAACSFSPPASAERWGGWLPGRGPG